jgi:hypothetical protein
MTHDGVGVGAGGGGAGLGDGADDAPEDPGRLRRRGWPRAFEARPVLLEPGEATGLGPVVPGWSACWDAGRVRGDRW